MATVLERFAGYATSLNEAPLPSDALHHARRCVLDWFAAAIPGAVPRDRILAGCLDLVDKRGLHATGDIE